MSLSFNNIFKRGISFRYRFIFSFVTLEVIFLLMIVSINFNSIQKTSNTLMNEKVNVFRALATETLVTPMLIYDLATIDNILFKFKDIGGVVGSAIYDRNDKLLSKNGILDDNFSYTIKERIIFENEFIGTVIINLDFTNIVNRIDKNKDTVIQIIILEILASIILSYLIGNRISINLETLTKKVELIADNKKIQIPEMNASYEVNVLISSLNSMQIKLEDKQQRLDEKNRMIDKYIISSETDINGIIKYASSAFCEISGYTHDELIGKNHNIIRHPDVSREFFKKMWNTIKNGKTWNGVIKNKKKSGETYWVNSFIEPIFKDDNIIGYRAIRQNITENILLEKISITDGLTGIYNRRYFIEFSPKYMNSAKRSKELISFLMMDIDYFKNYNDNYGHKKGDEVLCNVANTIKKSLKRADDFCFRLGGEEFAVLYKSDCEDKAYIFAELIRKNIENLKVKHDYSSVNNYVTVSAGLVCKNANEIDSIDSIYVQADELLYKAKSNGRNRVEMI